MNLQRILVLLIAFALYPNNNVFAQYDVLASSGRNSLFNNYLMNELDEVIINRNEALEASLVSKEMFLERQTQLRKNYLQLLGEFPEKTPLNAAITSTINSTVGYYIEKIHYQSVPNHHVTANFYVPTTGTSPYPTVIFLCGHYPVAKSYVDYQKLCILLAKNGIAAFIVDPICQGERYQATNKNGDLSMLGESGTGAHSRLDVGAVLAGTSVVAYQLWDNHRGVDYLYSRSDVVDTARVGCLGHSGGGAQATYLLAFDERLKVGSVANFITNETSMFSGGPQTASQNLSYEGEMELDEPDYVELFAPKPYLMIATSTDKIFKMDAAVETMTEVQKVYDLLEAPNNVSLYKTNDGHDYTQIKRQETVRWFKQWFYNNGDVIEEPSLRTLSERALQVSSKGQVMTSFENEKNITDLNEQLATSLAIKRTEFWNDHSQSACLDTIQSLIKLEPLLDEVHYEAKGTIQRSGYGIEKGLISYEEHVPVTALTFIPENNEKKHPAVIYVDGRGKSTEAGSSGVIEQVFMKADYVVMSIDVRGFGETADNSSKNESKHNNKEHRNAVISLYDGKTLVGQRVQDIQKALEVLSSRSDIDTANISIVGVDRASVAVLHAAALDSRFKNVQILNASQTPWLDAVTDANIADQMTHEVPSALMYYSIFDLIEKVIHPRKVLFGDEPVLPVQTGLSSLDVSDNDFQNYPNPFNTYSVITATVPLGSDVSIDVYAANGVKWKTLHYLELAGGEHQFDLSAQDFKPGMYWYTVNINNEKVASRAMIIHP